MKKTRAEKGNGGGEWRDRLGQEHGTTAVYLRSGVLQHNRIGPPNFLISMSMKMIVTQVQEQHAERQSRWLLAVRADIPKLNSPRGCGCKIAESSGTSGHRF